MIFLATLVTEHRGRSFRRIDRGEAGDGLMATAAVVARRFQILPVTVETGVMRMRQGLEVSIGRWIACSRRNQRNRFPAVIRLMTDRAVVVISFCLVLGCRESNAYEAHAGGRGSSPRVSKGVFVFV